MTKAEMEVVIEGMEQAEDTRQDAEMIAEEEGMTFKNLHLGTYRVAEVQAPKNFYNRGETKDVAITYAG